MGALGTVDGVEIIQDGWALFPNDASLGVVRLMVDEK